MKNCIYCEKVFEEKHQSFFCQKACRVQYNRNGKKPKRELKSKKYKYDSGIEFFRPHFDYEGNSI